MSSKQDELKNLLCYQRRDVPDIGLYGKLNFEDMKRIDRTIYGDITNSKGCCLYNGTIVGNKYSTFSFNGKKTSLIRMLYHNFINDIDPNKRVEWSCKNKGLCCNLSHFDMVLKDIPEKEENLILGGENQENKKIDENIFKFDDD